MKYIFSTDIHFSNGDNESYEKRLRPVLSMWKKLYSVSQIVSCSCYVLDICGISYPMVLQRNR